MGYSSSSIQLEMVATHPDSQALLDLSFHPLLLSAHNTCIIPIDVMSCSIHCQAIVPVCICDCSLLLNCILVQSSSGLIYLYSCTIVRIYMVLTLIRKHLRVRFVLKTALILTFFTALCTFSLSPLIRSAGIWSNFSCCI